MEEKSKTKKAKAIIGILGLGIIGTAIWELLIRDFLFYIGNLFVEFSSVFYTDYLDEIYSRVGGGDYSLYLFPTVFLLITIIISPLYLFLRIKVHFSINDIKSKEQSSIEESSFGKVIVYIFSKKIRAYLLIGIVSIPISILYIHTLILQIGTFTAFRTIEKNLIIIKPYLDSNQYDMLNSKFRQVNNKDKLIETLKSINVIAKKNKINLGDSRLLGIGTIKDIQ